MKVKPLFYTIIYVGILFVVNCLIDEFGYGLLKFVSFTFPLGGYTALICVHLMPILAVSFVSFTAGVIFYASPKTIRLASVVFIIVNWFFAVSWQVSLSIQMQENFSFSKFALVTLFDMLTLVVVLFITKWLCLGGRRLQDTMKKHLSGILYHKETS